LSLESLLNEYTRQNTCIKSKEESIPYEQLAIKWKGLELEALGAMRSLIGDIV